MPNGHDKVYLVIALAGKDPATLKQELDAGEAAGFDQFRGINQDFIVLYGAPKH